MATQQFVPSNEIAQIWEDSAADEQDVWDMCPWAQVVIPCEGGWTLGGGKFKADNRSAPPGSLVSVGEPIGGPE